MREWESLHMADRKFRASLDSTSARASLGLDSTSARASLGLDSTSARASSRPTSAPSGTPGRGGGVTESDLAAAKVQVKQECLQQKAAEWRAAERTHAVITPLALISHPCCHITPLLSYHTLALISLPFYSYYTPCSHITPLALISHPCSHITPFVAYHTLCSHITPFFSYHHPRISTSLKLRIIKSIMSTNSIISSRSLTRLLACSLISLTRLLTR